ncbi:NapC/NirT family cytochrome c [Alkalilimnicola ehrlichii MLHE-1]|uniref:Cytochrome c-type protein n=1 Tax=Alkalilimnicola ehrlichii (strain ATCC BAA-1101 / DSM 17681 / MLHE-1) TaxID=187272 RepID=Q0A813_ALKEH|nr:NapC/NirT family cytochrome c [Alkalilimnicola ehrlichii]ABI57024.1 NapC/NirT cytochrome c domain protein [Alkalilimnicola ehrlichii MLHE-1]
MGKIKRGIRYILRPPTKLATCAVISAVAIVVLGFFASVNAFVAFTNTSEFCASCHSIAPAVEEWRESSHYANAHGVRAECADCHVPDTLGATLAAKVRAINDIYHHFAGTIDTPEKFEERRPVLAQRVWDAMEADDSLACRSCHSWDSMDLAQQSGRGGRNHREAMEEGKTCISCHQGVVHKLPGEDEDPGFDLGL